jgi:Family of unknown function (DUF6194)
VDEASIRGYIVQTFPDISVVDGTGGAFFFTDPERKFPFATLVTSDEYDQASDLGRPGVFRLNIGVSKQTFGTLFGAPPPASGGEGGYDYTALDRIMPHPVYGKMYWVCVLNPSAETFETVRGLLAEAYEAGMRQRAKRAETNAASDRRGT